MSPMTALSDIVRPDKCSRLVRGALCFVFFDKAYICDLKILAPGNLETAVDMRGQGQPPQAHALFHGWTATQTVLDTGPCKLFFP